MKAFAGFRHLTEWCLVVILQRMLRGSPNLWIPVIGDGLGLLFRVLRIRYRVAYDNISLALPDIPACEVLKKNYRHLGRTFASSLVLSSYHPDIVMKVPDRFFDDLDHGSVLLTGHLGHWELLGKTLVRNGVRLAVVVRRQSNPKVDKQINDERRAAGMEVVYDSDLWGMIRLLRRGYSIGLLADQDFGRNTVPIRFFGRNCFSPKGLEFFSRFHVPMFYSAAVYTTSGRWEVIAERVCAPSGERAQAYADWLESMIRQFPEQWLWQHRRWKSAFKTLATHSNPALLYRNTIS